MGWPMVYSKYVLCYMRYASCALKGHLYGLDLIRHNNWLNIPNFRA